MKEPYRLFATPVQLRSSTVFYFPYYRPFATIYTTCFFTYTIMITLIYYWEETKVNLSPVMLSNILYLEKHSELLIATNCRFSQWEKAVSSFGYESAHLICVDVIIDSRLYLKNALGGTGVDNWRTQTSNHKWPSLNDKLKYSRPVIWFSVCWDF